MTLPFSRPWDNSALVAGVGYSNKDCLIGLLSGETTRKDNCSILMRGTLENKSQSLVLYPYPKAPNTDQPPCREFIVRPPNRNSNESDEDQEARDILSHMNRVISRVQELGEVLDDPMNMWAQLAAAWERAEHEEEPRMSEIVRQARKITPVLKALDGKLRRVLRRSREMVRLDRVQEMDRGSIRWLVRQPGTTIAERAGSGQRIKAIVRRENYDTPENRVLHSYTKLADLVAKNWLSEHPKARSSQRYRDVDQFRILLKRIAAGLDDMGIGLARASIIPNYVLMQNADYNAVYVAWNRLLQQQKVVDDLWAWQAETWTDFSVLAIILALHDLEESELIAQSPIVWLGEAVLGRWFQQDRPIAVFWLKETARIVEIHARPRDCGKLVFSSRAHVTLKISDPSRREYPRRIAVWTPHALQRIDLEQAVLDANTRLRDLQRLSGTEVMRRGLVLTPARNRPQACSSPSDERTRVEGIALDASGEGLATGLEAIRAFVRGDIFGDGL